ncbi:MAG: efflux transporter periplasmic adaptor subunit [Caulobacter sp.]|nr:efflux transporter periplasmic adaptor subunit [Caulobacter sp.]
MQRTRTIRAAFAVAIILALPLAACGKKKDAAAAAPRAALTISVATAQQTLLPRTVDASGTITAWQEVAVGAETGGLTAVQVLADEGSWVKQGQLLVQMDASVLIASVKQAEAGVVSAKATLAQAESDLARSQELNAKGYLAKAALDQKVAAQGTASANLVSAQAALGAARARLAQASVRAPVSGLITSRKVVKGQIVTAGAELFTLVRDGRLELAAQVPETQLALLHPGMAGTISSDQVGRMSGAVRVITPEVDPQTRVGLARIALTSPGGFRPGMFANGQINVGALPALTAPQGAILYRDNKPGLFVIDAQNIAHYRQVQTGAKSGDLMEVTSGLNAGERVATDGAGFLADGDHVRVAARAAQPPPSASSARTPGAN